MMRGKANMRAEYRKELSHNYMVLSFSGDISETDYRMKTMLSNRIEGLLPMAVEHAEDGIRCRYDITGLKPFAACLRSLGVTSDDLKRIYIRLYDTLGRLEDYLLDPDYLLLSPEYLYIRWESRTLYMAYTPERMGRFTGNLEAFTEYLITKSGSYGRESTFLLCDILGKLRSDPSGLPDLGCVIRGGDDGGKRTYPKENDIPDAAVWETGMPGNISEEMPDTYETEEYLKPEIQDSEGREFGKRKAGSGLLPERYTVILAAFMAMGAAVVWTAMRLQTEYRLSIPEMAAGAAAGAGVIFLCAFAAGAAAGRMKVPAAAGFVSDRDSGEADADCLPPGMPVFEGQEMQFSWMDREPEEDSYRTETEGKTVLLENFVSPAGGIPATLTPAEKGSALPSLILEERDLLIGKKESLSDRIIPDETVSRIHARISYADGKYRICDMGSSNGTRVNGRPAIGGEEIALEDGARVMFAGCEYVFHEGKKTG